MLQSRDPSVRLLGTPERRPCNRYLPKDPQKREADLRDRHFLYVRSVNQIFFPIFAARLQKWCGIPCLVRRTGNSRAFFNPFCPE